MAKKTDTTNLFRIVALVAALVLLVAAGLVYMQPSGGGAAVGKALTMPPNPDLREKPGVVAALRMGAEELVDPLVERCRRPMLQALEDTLAHVREHEGIAIDLARDAERIVGALFAALVTAYLVAVY